METPTVYALLDSDTYKTLNIDEDTDSLTVKTGETVSTVPYDETAGVNKFINGALIGYKLGDDGAVVDMTYIGNATTEQWGGDTYALDPDTIRTFDGDTYKLTFSNGKTYLLTDNTKVFIYKTDALGSGPNSDGTYDGDSTTTARDNSKVITASELADITKYNYDVTATSVVLTGASNSSTIEAIAIEADDGYYTASAGNKYPALIKSITQTVVSGSTSKYSYTIEAYINGSMQTLKTENKTNSNFYEEIMGKAATAADVENKFAWITLNSSGVVTKINLVSDSMSDAGLEDTDTNKSVKGYTATRAVVVSKSSKGLTYIPNGSWSFNGTTGTVDAIDVNGKTSNSNFSAFKNDTAIYTLNVRPAYNEITNKVKENKLDGSYTCEAGTVSDIQVSTITDNTSTNVYYIADIFFDEDGDILAVYSYTKDLSNAKTTSSSSTTTTKELTVALGTESGTSRAPITVTVTNAVSNDTYVADIFEKQGITGDITIYDTSSGTLVDKGNVDIKKYVAGANTTDKDLLYYSTTTGKYYKLTYVDDAKAAADDAAAAKEEQVAAATADIKAAKDALDAANATLAAAAPAVAEEQAKVDEAQKAADAAAETLESATKTATEASDAYDTAKAAYDKAAAKAKESDYTDAASAIDTAEKGAIKTAQEAYDQAVSDYDAAVDAYEAAQTDATKTPDERNTLEQAVTDANNTVTEKLAALNAEKAKIADQQQLVAAVDAEILSTSKTAAEALKAKNEAETAQTQAQTDKDKADEALKDAQDALDAAEQKVSSNSAYNEAVDKVAEAEKAYVEALQAAIDDGLTSADLGMTDKQLTDLGVKLPATK
jgi:hypothetical protein